MKYSSESIGSRLIETITSGLYDGNLNCLREYVQNSIDSGANNIEIYFETKNNLIIRDNGTGMNNKEIEMALSIGISKKSDDNIGWRGIGIWSGVPACKKIVLISKKSFNKKYRVEINNEILRNGSMSDRPFLTVFEEATGEIEEMPLGREESLEIDHFTEIRLESILKTQKSLFTDKEIRKYLSSTVPAPFDEINFILGRKINDWLDENDIIIPNVNITFENKKIFRYPERSDIFFNEIIRKEFRVNGELIAVGWFVTSIDNKTLPMPNGGIYFKKKGFTIGDANLVEKLNITENYSRWQYGEIHIISKDIRENAARNNFEFNTPYIEVFQEIVGAFISELQTQNRYQSDKNQTKSIISAQKFLEKGDFSSTERTIRKAIENLSRVRNYPNDQALQGMKCHIDDVTQQNIRDIVDLEQKLKLMDPQYQGNLSELIEKAQQSMKNASEPKTPENHEEKKENGDVSSEKSQEDSDDDAEPIDRAIMDDAKDSERSSGVPKAKRESLLDAVRRNLCPAMRASVARSTKAALGEFEISATDPIKELLIRKTGHNPNKHEIYGLSKFAYGWDEKAKGGWRIEPQDPILFLDKTNKRRNRLFGIMVYIVHDLLVNLSKHEKGKESFKWLEKSTKDDRETLIAEAYAVIDFIYRLIDKSEKNP